MAMRLANPPQYTLSVLNQVADRFWDLVDREGKAANECWEWIGPLRCKKYGEFNVNRRLRLSAGRVAWELTNNELIGENRLAIHMCSNTFCCNPDHIRAIHRTHPDAVRVHNRLGRAKLSRDQVKEIRQRYVLGNGGALAREYGVSDNAIWMIVNQRTWKDV